MYAAQKRVKAGWLSGAGISFALLLAAPLQAEAASQTRESRWGYDSAGMINIEQIETGQFELKTEYTYDAFGNKLTVTVSSSATGTAEIAPRTTSTTYTADGRFPHIVTNALGQSETRQYHPAFGQLTSQTGPNGLTTSWEYDSFGRKILETRPDGTKTKWDYQWCTGYGVAPFITTCPGLARYAIVTTPLANDGTTQIGPKTIQYMDMLEREVRVETQGWASTAEPSKAIYADTEYDSFGRVYRKSRPYYAGATPTWTEFVYDAIGRVVKEKRPQEEVVNGVLQAVTKEVTIAYRVETITVDGVSITGPVTEVTNEWNEKRITTKNSQGQTVMVKNGRDDGSTSLWTVNRYSYDPFGNLVEVKDTLADGTDTNTVTFTYDPRGRKIAMSDPDKGDWSYEYDALGQLKKQTDAKGQVTEMTYDLLGRTTSRVIKDASAAVQQTDSWVYDEGTKAIGKLSSASSTDGLGNVIHTRTQEYDPLLGRPWRTGLSQRISDTAPYSYSTNYYTQQYDALGRLSSLAYPSGLTLSYAYSDLSELLSVTNTATSTAVWTLNTRNAARQLTGETYGNGVSGTRQYEVGRGLVQFIEAKNGGTTLQRWDIGYDSVGNVTSRKETYLTNPELGTTATGQWEKLEYDSLNRLIKVRHGSTDVLTLEMAYERGNIVSKSDVGTYTYPSAGSAQPHAVASIAGIGGQPNRTYTYDDNGNMISGDGRTLAWNAFDMPTSITKGASTLSFAYDADHHRIRQVTPSEQKHYLNDPVTGARSERKLSLAGAELRWDSYIMVQGELVSLVTRELGKGEAADVVTARYFHRDHLGSTTMLTDAVGAITQRFRYDAWGKQSIVQGPLGMEVDRGFTGHEQLEEVELVHMNGRLYDATIARFVSADPIIQDPMSTLAFNRYAYVDNNPCTLIDPTGYLSFKRIKNFFRSNPIASLVVGLAAAWATGGLSFTATGISMTWGGAVVAGAVSGVLTGGLQGGILGGVSGALTFGIGSIAKDIGWLAAAALHGTAQGSLAAIQGGEFGAAFLGAALGSAGASGLQAVMPGKTFDVVLLKTVGSAVIGGTAAAIGGGKFQNGAATSAFIYMFNHVGEMLGKEASLQRYKPILEQGNINIDANAALAKKMTDAEFVWKVMPGGDWDYKRAPLLVQGWKAGLYTNDLLQEFGNYHFGYVANAHGYSLAFSLAGGGVVQSVWQGGGNKTDAWAGMNAAMRGMSNSSAALVTKFGFQWGDNPGDSRAILNGWVNFLEMK